MGGSHGLQGPSSRTPLREADISHEVPQRVARARGIDGSHGGQNQGIKAPVSPRGGKDRDKNGQGVNPTSEEEDDIPCPSLLGHLPE